MPTYDLKEACKIRGAKAKIAKCVRKQPSLIAHYANFGEYLLEIENATARIIRKEKEVSRGRVGKTGLVELLSGCGEV